MTRANGMCVAVRAIAILACVASIAAEVAGAARHRAEPPTVALAANVATGGVTRPGWPILVTVTTISGIDTTGAPIVATAPEVVPRLIDARGAPVALAFERVAAPANDGATQSWAWIASDAATRTLAPGSYRVAADTTGRAKPFRWSFGTLEVEAASTTKSAGEDLMRIESEAVAGRFDTALGIADRMIAADSSDVRAWGIRGDLLMAKDAPDLALAAYGQALRRKGEGEAIDLLRRQHAAFDRLLAKSAKR